MEIIQDLLFPALVLGFLLSFHDWRQGMLLCIVAGFLADPLRKVIPGQPVYFVVLVGGFVAVVFAGFVSRYGSFRFRHLGPLYSIMKTPFTLFVIWLAYEALISFFRYGSPVLVGISLLSYLAPVPAFLIAYYYGLTTGDVVRFIKFYLLCSVLMLSGIYLSYFGVDWAVLKEVGSGVQIFGPAGILDAFPGFFRSTEVAAWHTGAAICLFLVLVVSGVVRWPKTLVAGLILLVLIAGVLTGRRKMLMEVLIFVCFYSGLLLWFRGGARRIVIITLLMGALLGFAGMFGIADSPTAERLDPYLSRGSTVLGDAEERFTKLGINSVFWAMRGYGILGGGLGVASQGAQHFGGGAQRFGGAGEGGLGKITAELGLPGLFFVFWMAAKLLNYQWQMLKAMSGKSIPLTSLWYGISAFLAANIPMFIVASQVFGDLFILLLLGWFFGFTVALSRAVLTADISHRKPAEMNGGNSDQLVVFSSFSG